MEAINGAVATMTYGGGFDSSDFESICSPPTFDVTLAAAPDHLDIVIADSTDTLDVTLGQLADGQYEVAACGAGRPARSRSRSTSSAGRVARARDQKTWFAIR